MCEDLDSSSSRVFLGFPAGVLDQERKMEGAGGGSGRLMSFGENSHGLGSMLMMPPTVDSCNNNLFLPPANQQDLTIRHGSLSGVEGSSSMMPEEHYNSNMSTSTGYYLMENINDAGSGSVKANIMAHPYYQRLLAAYVNCQKIGAPPEVVARLEEACTSAVALGRQGTSCVGEDPALDQFMEAYCEMLTKYEQELSKPFAEAMLFLSRIECQFKSLSLSPMDSDNSLAACGEAMDRNGSSEEDVDVNNSRIDPLAEDHELKGQLLRKYSGYLGSLKQEFMKKRKKGKLPKEARQQLLDWWSNHYKWPYPSEAQKLALVESTGLDQKQINNWFINQRKRHWKPSEDMQFLVMDAMHPHFYMDNVLCNPFPTDMSSTFL